MPLSLELLGPEILMMIFEQIYNVAPELLPCLRLMCRRIDQIVAPISYRRIVFSVKKLGAVSSSAKREDIVHNIHAHTRHVEFPRLLDWDAVVELLSGCVQLDEMTLVHRPRIVIDSVKNGHVGKTCSVATSQMRCVALSVKSGLQSALPTTLWTTLENSDMERFYEHFLPPTCEPYTPPLQEFLASCTNLETLHLHDLMGVFEPDKGRLPPIQKLIMSPFQWQHTAEEAALIWDFSRLEDLEIPWKTLDFLSGSAPLPNFKRLRRLKIEHTWQGPDLSRPVEEVSENIKCTQFLDSILMQAPEDQFEYLDIKCHLPSFSISAITRHGQSLRVLKLLDTSGYEVDGYITPTITVLDLNTLQCSCPNITNLTLGVNIVSPQKPPKLYVPVTHDRVLDFGRYLAQRLYKQKAGLPLSQVSVNVGEWTSSNRAHRLIKTWHVKMDISEAYQPQRFIKFSWDSQGSTTLKEPVRDWEKDNA
ncbi:hypothetical protein BKA65DRAFT_476866 [Rhexocercosporidium sp. MPI-PUGE-AT-0058]|nr:hypothetical protein BKA65DRAFT_476866 [Rhexocercosporidium sp. MPI-PUGE-AT-0058]